MGEWRSEWEGTDLGHHADHELLSSVAGLHSHDQHYVNLRGQSRNKHMTTALIT